MKVLFVSANYSNFFALDPVVRELIRRGHQTHLIVGMEEKRNLSDEALQIARTELAGLVVRPLSARRFLRGIAQTIREILNYAHVLNNEKDRTWDVVKWRRFFHPWLWSVLNIPSVKTTLKDRSFQKKLRGLEQRIPVDTAIWEEIRSHHPDVVVLSPLINAQSLEADYLLAAKSLGIPTVYFMLSWDNIATKGTFHGQPDYGIVWNESLADELARLHDFPRHRIYITGAPRFAHLENCPTDYIQPRQSFCQQAGLEADKPFILYVGSTFLVNSEYKKEIDESILILEIARELSADPRTSELNILVRPHPLNSGIVTKLLDSGQRNVFVFPKNGEIPDTEEKQIRYYNSIFHSMAVAGVNTTAFLEAAAFDKVCITVYSKQFSETQRLAHFHHIVNAGFLEKAMGGRGVAEIASQVKNGRDLYQKERRAFVKNFLWPFEKAAPQICADVLEEIVSSKAR